MKTISLSIILALASIFPLQAQYSIGGYESALPSFDYYYKPFSEQTDIFNLYAPSEITLQNHFAFYAPDSGDWIDMPYAPYGPESALSIPVGNGLWVLVMCVLSYVIYVQRKTKSYKF
jgi:hypothetical protein